MANAVNQEDRSRFACKICARLVADPVMIADGPRLALESMLRLSDRLTAESQETGAKASTETVAPHLHLHLLRPTPLFRHCRQMPHATQPSPLDGGAAQTMGLAG